MRVYKVTHSTTPFISTRTEGNKGGLEGSCSNVLSTLQSCTQKGVEASIAFRRIDAFSINYSKIFACTSMQVDKDAFSQTYSEQSSRYLTT